MINKIRPAAVVVAMAIAGFGAAKQAVAGPITGGLSVDGTASDNTSTDVLTFTGAGNVGANTATGSYLAPFGTGCNDCVNFPSTFNYTGSTGNQQFFVAGENGSTADFTETAITDVVKLSKGVVDIYIKGSASLTGFSNTGFSGELTIQGNGNTTFSASTQSNGVPVDEPASVKLLTGAVLALSLLGLRRGSKTAGSTPV